MTELLISVEEVEEEGGPEEVVAVVIKDPAIVEVDGELVPGFYFDPAMALKVAKAIVGAADQIVNKRVDQ